MRRPLLWVGVFLGWTLIAVVFSVSSSLTYAATYRPPQWGRTFVLALTEWYAWAVITPLVVWLARRFQLQRERWMGHALLLCGIALPVVVAKVALTRTVRAVWGTTDYFLVSNLFAHYAIFWAIVAIVHIARYYSDERGREMRATHAEARLAEARLQLLRMQLHPHFLFNTLNAISELVHENPSTAERMIEGLSRLLRETLDSGTADLIPLSRELGLLRRYVDIQCERFGSRLQVRIDAPEDAGEGAMIPIFLLQPLVENAITHGISARRGEGHIEVRARVDDLHLRLEVIDDGVGVDQSQMREGIGLANTRARLSALYGAAHSFQVAAAPGGGTVVRVVLPCVAAGPVSA